MTEIWKELEGFSNYKFSNTGKVWSKSSNKEMSLQAKCSGYLTITVMNDEGNRHTMMVHRFIAWSFIPNPENKPTVNHINHNRADNRVENLEWATISEQNNHKKKPLKEVTRLMGARAVWRCSLDGKKIEYYKSVTDAEDWVFKNKGSQNTSGHISAVCLNKRNRRTAYGFKWIHDTSEDEIFENEIWKNIPKELVNGYTGYKISSYGRIKKIKNNQFLRGHLYSTGYRCVGIGNMSEKGRKYLIHRLVAQVFLPNYYGKSFVNHKDHDKTNCKLYNLEWVTPKENAIAAVKHYSKLKNNF